MPEHRTFFGDQERSFKLTASMIVELERLRGAGIGLLIKRTISRDFYHADIIETIRLSLIGGGMSPTEAHSLVNAYVIDRPLSETYPLALAILENLFAGDPEPEKESADDAAE